MIRLTWDWYRPCALYFHTAKICRIPQQPQLRWCAGGGLLLSDSNIHHAEVALFQFYPARAIQGLWCYFLSHRSFGFHSWSLQSSIFFLVQFSGCYTQVLLTSTLHYLLNLLCTSISMDSAVDGVELVGQWWWVLAVDVVMYIRALFTEILSFYVFHYPIFNDGAIRYYPCCQAQLKDQIVNSKESSLWRCPWLPFPWSSFIHLTFTRIPLCLILFCHISD